MERFFEFDDYNTFIDWNLILIDKKISLPEPKTKYVEIEGCDGTLDLSEALSGTVIYNDRVISASFWTDYKTRDDRNRLFKEIRNLLHGRKVKIIEPDDLEHFFVGRISVKNEINNLAYGEIEIECVCEPYRYNLNNVVRTITLISENETVISIVNNGSKKIVPDIEVNGSINVETEKRKIPLNNGLHRILDIKLNPGVNSIKLSGEGTVTFKFREAVL